MKCFFGLENVWMSNDVIFCTQFNRVTAHLKIIVLVLPSFTESTLLVRPFPLLARQIPGEKTFKNIPSPATPTASPIPNGLFYRFRRVAL